MSIAKLTQSKQAVSRLGFAAIVCAVAVLTTAVVYSSVPDASSAEEVLIPVMAFDAETGTLTITGAGEITKAAVDETVGSGKLKAVVIGRDVTSVGASAFGRIWSLESVVFEPGCAASIGDEAFIMCKNLSALTLADNPSIGSRAFYFSGITSVTIPATVADIGACSFSDTALTSVSVPSTVTSLGEGAFSSCRQLVSAEVKCPVSAIGNSIFSGCSSLTDLTMPPMENIPDGMFAGCYQYKAQIPENVKTIGHNAYSGCNIESVEFPGTLVSVGEYSFQRCNNLASVSFANCDSAEIGKGAFQNCSVLKDVILPGSSPSINEDVFRNCALIENISIPPTVRSIGSGAFNGCSSLKDIVLPAELQTIGNTAFFGCSSVEKVTLPSGLSSIGIGAFGKCSSLENVEFPSALQTINQGAFGECTSLKSVVTGEGLNKLGDTAFYKCSALKTADLSASSSLEEILWGTFAHCESLESVTLSESGISDIYDSAFDGDKAIETFDIPASVKSLGKKTSGNSELGTFGDCINLKKITGGEGLTSIEDKTFVGCLSLSSFAGFNLNSEYFVIKDNAIYSKTGSGLRMIQLACAATGDFVIPDSVTAFDSFAMVHSSVNSIVFGKGTNKIKTSVSGNTNLISVTIPEGVTEIGCGDKENGMFSGCESLVSVSLPSTLEKIGRGTFEKCTSLQDIALPKDLTELGEKYGGGAFEKCSSLKTITILGSIKEQEADVVLPDGITVLYGNTFNGCASMESIYLNVESIREGNFSNCDSLNYVGFGIYTEFIKGSFNDCKSLSSVTLDGIDLNIEGSFKNCDGLKTVHLGDGVKSIEGSFIGCDTLESITVSYYNKNLATFKGMILSANYKHVVLIPSYVVDMELPDSVTEMPRLDTCRETVRSIKTGNGISDIGYNVQGCKVLESLTLGAGISKVAMGAFAGCKSLTNVTVNSDKMIVSGGLIYNQDGSEIYACIPTVKTVVMRDSVSVMPTSSLFSECADLESITFGAGITAEALVAMANTGNYWGCPSLVEFKFNNDGIRGVDGLALTADGTRLILCAPGIEEVRIPNTVKIIGPKAFTSCLKPVSISLPDGVETIMGGAFSSSPGIRSISIPASVRTIEEASICGCTALENISVDPGNATYAVKDGVLYSKADLRSIAVCGAFSTVTIPEEVKIIGSQSVSCKNISTVVLGPNVEKIEERAFQGCGVKDLFVTGETMPECLSDVGVPELRVHSNIKGGVFDGFHQGFTYDNLPQTKITVVSVGDGHTLERPIPTVIPKGGNIKTDIIVEEGYDVTVEASAGTVDKRGMPPSFTFLISDISEDATIAITSARIAVEATGISLDVHEITAGSNAPYVLNATPVPENTTETVFWSSGDTSIATVDGGVVTPVSIGTVVITATVGRFSDSCTITFTTVISAGDVKNAKTVEAVVEGEGDEVFIPSGTADRMRDYSASVKAATIGNGKWSIYVPASALDAVIGSGKDVTVSVASVDQNAIPENIRSAAGGRAVFRLSIAHDGEQVTDLFGSDVTVTVPYVLSDGEDTDNLVIVCLGGNSSVEKYGATYADGKLTFNVPHFSYWALDHGRTDGSGSDGSSLDMLLIAVALVIAVSMIAYFVGFRHKTV